MLCTLRRGDSLEVDQASSLPDESLRHDSSPRARLARKQSLGLKALRVLTPTPGWCSASQCCVGRALRRCMRGACQGTCSRAAASRLEASELASTHAFTLPKDAVFEVRERRVNEQGLARLQDGRPVTRGPEPPERAERTGSGALACCGAFDV